MRIRRAAATAAVLAFAGLGAVAAPAGAAGSMTLESCEGFNVIVTIADGGHVTSHKVRGGDMITGTGAPLTYTNSVTFKSFSTKSNGARQFTSADGRTLIGTGHNVVALTGHDTGAPSTLLFNGGRYVISVDDQGLWTIVSQTGNVVDVCAALS